MTKQIELSPKQCEYIQNATHRYNGKIGARQCGKTHIDVAYMIPSRLLERKGKKGLNFILGVTKETIERNVLEPMRDFWGNSAVGAISSRNIAILFGEKVYCLGAEKVSQVSKMRGAKVKYLYIDEIVDINQEVFEILKSGMSLDYSVCDFTGNPQNPQHYVKSFIDSDVDVYSQHLTIYDNPFLSPEIIHAFETEYAGTVYFTRYVLGQWAIAEGLVYPMFAPDLHVVPDELRPYEKYWVSMDYGIQNATVMQLWGLADGVYYCVREYYHSGRDTNNQKTDDEYYTELERLIGNLPVEWVIVDPSAASFITLIVRRRRFRVVKAANDVTDGISECCSVLKNGLVRFSERCERTIKEFGLYRWDNKSTEDKVIKAYDHAMDAFRYFVYTLGFALPKRNKTHKRKEVTRRR